MTPTSREPSFTLHRGEVVPRLVGRPEDFLIVTGLAGTAREFMALTDHGANVFPLAGAMGAAVSMGIGLALARPDKRVLVPTGDGELLMNVGALATAALMNPPNLAILCVDNGHYGETGYQKSHTSICVDLEQMAQGAGIRSTTTVESEEQIETGARLLRQGNGTSFVLLRVVPEDPPRSDKARDLDPVNARIRFRQALLGYA